MKRKRFGQLLLAAECDMRGRGEDQHELRTREYPQPAYLQRALDAARAVNAGEVAQRCGDDKAGIPHAVHGARVSAVKAAIGAQE